MNDASPRVGRAHFVSRAALQLENPINHPPTSTNPCCPPTVQQVFAPPVSDMGGDKEGDLALRYSDWCTIARALHLGTDTTGLSNNQLAEVYVASCLCSGIIPPLPRSNSPPVAGAHGSGSGITHSGAMPSPLPRGRDGVGGRSSTTALTPRSGRSVRKAATTTRVTGRKVPLHVEQRFQAEQNAQRHRAADTTKFTSSVRARKERESGRKTE